MLLINQYPGLRQMAHMLNLACLVQSPDDVELELTLLFGGRTDELPALEQQWQSMEESEREDLVQRDVGPIELCAFVDSCSLYANGFYTQSDKQSEWVDQQRQRVQAELAAS